MGFFVPLSSHPNPRMIAATHAAFATGLYLGGSALFECPAEPVGWGLAIFFSLVRGIDLFWPSPIRVVLPGRTAYRLDVGGKAERVLLPGLVVLAVAMAPVSRMGVRGGLHQLLRNFDMAFDEYRVGAGTPTFHFAPRWGGRLSDAIGPDA